MFCCFDKPLSKFFRIFALKYVIINFKIKKNENNFYEDVACRSGSPNSDFNFVFGR